ncbi:hypothetical protein K443DRAFT_82322, partial [Laccaria amethystina LaAM-08-1]
YWTIISTRNRVDSIFFLISTEFLVGAPKFWVEILETTCTASWPLSSTITQSGHKNKRGLIVRDCT